MSRLFTFGCSYTNYPWKTWADILAEEYGELINLGQINGGNEQIFFKIINAHKKYLFSPQDTVAVCWTFYLRKDDYKINKWVPRDRPTAQDDWKGWFKKENVNPDEQWLRTVSYISAINKLIPSICNYICFSTIDYGLRSTEKVVTPWDNHETDRLFAEEINQFTDNNYDTVFDISQDRDCKNRISLELRPTDRYGGLDEHPTPKEHLYFLEHVMKINVSDSTKQKVEQWEQEMRPRHKYKRWLT